MRFIETHEVGRPNGEPDKHAMKVTVETASEMISLEEARAEVDGWLDQIKLKTGRCSGLLRTNSPRECASEPSTCLLSTTRSARWRGAILPAARARSQQNHSGGNFEG